MLTQYKLLLFYLSVQVNSHFVQRKSLFNKEFDRICTHALRALYIWEEIKNGTQTN